MSTTAVAYPFVDVHVDTKGLQPTAQRAPGVLAVVGIADTKAKPTAPTDPTMISDSSDAAKFGAKGNDLFDALILALEQDPGPSTIYAQAVGKVNNDDDWKGALDKLSGKTDITVVVLANQYAATSTSPLKLLMDHVEKMSSDGNKQIGVGSVDPAVARSDEYVDLVTAGTAADKTHATAALLSSRMVLVAARGSTEDPTDVKASYVDVAPAAAAAIAGYQPWISLVLKPITGFQIRPGSEYSASEIKALSAAGIDPIIDPSLISGAGLCFAEGRTYKPGDALEYIDTVRVLDDLDFKLKAGLVGQIGDSRITKSGLTLIKAQAESILATAQAQSEIDDYSVSIPVLDALNVPASSRSVPGEALVKNARQARQVDVYVSITYGPAVHQLRVTLTPTY